MKPANFPERKRQRQIRALARTSPLTLAGASNSVALAALTAAIAEGDQRSKRSKTDRTARGRFVRAES